MMTVIEVINNSNKNPNDLHDYLIDNNCNPYKLTHNKKYTEEGIREATKIWIEIEDEDKGKILSDLVNQFMSS